MYLPVCSLTLSSLVITCEKNGKNLCFYGFARVSGDTSVKSVKLERNGDIQKSTG